MRHSPRSGALTRAFLLFTVTVTVTAAGTSAGCGGPPASAREAQRRLLDGDLGGAEQLVDQELARFPKDPTLWNVRIRVRLARADAAGAVAAYRDWARLRGGADRGALNAMALTTLWQALASSSPELQRAAIAAAVALDEAALAEPVSRLLDADDAEVRAAAAAALIRSHPDAPIVLGQALESDSAAARALAVEALGAKVGKRAHDDIVAATRDPDQDVRVAACNALARLKLDGDAARLVELTRDPAGPVRAAALRALDAIGASETAATALAALDDQYLGARLAAVDALAARGGKGATEPLTRRAAAVDADPFVALRAGVALAHRKQQDAALAAFAAAVQSPEWTVRVAALNALTAMTKGKAAVALALPLAEDKEPAVRLAAARALLHADQRDAARTLFVAALALPDEWLRLQAAYDLMRMHEAQGQAALATLAASGTPSTREAAVGYLRLADEVDDALVGALADTAGTVRVAAALSILQLR